MKIMLAWKKRRQFPSLKSRLKKVFPGIDVDSFTLGKRALAALKQNGYDLLLLGSELSDMDFEQFLSSLSEMSAKIPLIILIYQPGLNDRVIRVVRLYACSFIREDEIHSPLLTYIIESRMEKSRMETETWTLQQMLVESALRDGLTKLYNYRYFKDTLHREFHRALRYGRNLTLIMWDIDDFKIINDSYGHIFGDFVLQSLSQILQDSSRSSDIIVRYGGEEFASILPETDSQMSYTVGERIRIGVSQTVFSRDDIKAHITVSGGIADLKMRGVTSEEELVRFADRALYSAKAMGKNKIVVYDPTFSF